MTSNTTIIIHSRVAAGYVGSNTTTLVLQMGGYEVINIPTVLYSNHLSHSTVGGGIIPYDLFSDILKGVMKLDILKSVSTIITGFIGTAEQAVIIAEFIRTLKSIKPDITYICDPVMGDLGKGQYVGSEIPSAIIEQLVPLADLLTPNQFEVEKIIGKNIDYSIELPLQLQERFDLSKQAIIITGGDDTSENTLITNTIIQDGKFSTVSSKKINLYPPGTGELFTAHTYLSMLRGNTLKDAVSVSGDILSAVILKMFNDNKIDFEIEDILYSMDFQNR